MALYDRECEQCNFVFEVNCKIAEKDHVHPCPKCKATSGKWLLSTPRAIPPDRLGRGRDGGFNEVLAKIHSQNYGSTLRDRNTF